ncbi:hypothetical protein ACP275_05G138300 [Erythranthe tilingii]
MQICYRHYTEFLEIQFHHRVSKHFRIFPGVALRYIHNIRFHHNRVNFFSAVFDQLVDRSHRPVVAQAVLAADDPEAEHVALVVEDLQPLGGGGGGEAGDHRQLADAAHAAVADEAAALDEVLVGLGVVEAADQRPHRLRRRVDPLRDEGCAGVGQCVEQVVGADDVLQLRVFLRRQTAVGDLRFVVHFLFFFFFFFFFNSRNQENGENERQ